MKAVLISIRPKWCELIASGKKTVEVRKTMPKLETPFKCYIYCTKYEQYKIAPFRFADGWKIKRYDAKTNWANGNTANMGYKLNGKVIGEFVCDKVNTIRRFGVGFDVGGVPISKSNFEAYKLIKESCLTERELRDYIIDDYGYCWHISDLKIYDKPKELSEFRKGCNDMSDPMYGSYCEYCEKKCFLTRPPQSWCYVEEIEK